MQASNVGDLGNVVPEGYAYHEKVIAANEDLALTDARLKWYDLFPADAPITAQERAVSRAFLAAEAGARRLALCGDLGFVILHRAGSTLLLLVTVWRNTNEMWEAVYMKSPAQDASYRQIMLEGTPRGTYCVWELGAVWHERNAWMRFLSSKRDDAAKLAYLNDRFAGRI